MKKHFFVIFQQQNAKKNVKVAEIKKKVLNKKRK
jgi:hypothetical protein